MKPILKGFALVLLFVAFVLVWNLGVRSGTVSAQSGSGKFSYLQYQPYLANGVFLDIRNGNCWKCDNHGCTYEGRVPLEQAVENPAK